MRWDREGMFRFLWQNRKQLELADDTYTRVNSVRPVWRVAPDGFILRETVVEYYQLVKQGSKRDLERYKMSVPDCVANGERFDLVGGGTLIFDEFGTLKYHISNHLTSERQAVRLTYLAETGYLNTRDTHPFAFAHLAASGMNLNRMARGDWP